MFRIRMGRISLIEVFTVIAILAIILSFFRGAFVNSDVALRALQTQGYSNVQITDHQWFAIGFRGCSEKDAAKFVAIATNPVGQRVELFVCTGWLFKGATVRTR